MKDKPPKKPADEVGVVSGPTVTDIPVEDPFVGQVLKDTFVIEERLAAGGMGVVYRGTQRPIGRPVAIKMLHPKLSRDPVLVQRFFREAKLLGSFAHPNVVQLIDFGHIDSSHFYLVTEFLDGQTLDKVVPEAGLPLADIQDIMGQLCAGVGAAHRRRLVHRDLKPGNIFLADLGGGCRVVKILDFGIARPMDDDAGLTKAGMVLGTPGYIAPELLQADSDPDPRSDIYSLGAVLYFMVSGKEPFSASSMSEVVRRQLLEPTKTIDFQALKQPHTLGPIVARALALRPNDRFPSAEALAAALAAQEDIGEWSREPVGDATVEMGELSPVAASAPVIQQPAAPRPSPPTTGRGRNLSVAALRSAMTPISLSRRRSSPWLRGWRGAVLWLAMAVVVSIGAATAAWTLSGAPLRALPGAVAERVGALWGGRDAAVMAVRGVYDDRIVLGMSAPFSGPSQALGEALRVGFETYFKSVNEAGGVHGRRLELLSLDDGYEPARTLKNMSAFFSSKPVFAITGNVGTPTSEVAAPIAVEDKTLFFGAFTGSGVLRKTPPERYVLNFRASYAEETSAIVHYFVRKKGIKPAQIAVFAQDDGYGDAGFRGVAETLRSYGVANAGDIVRVDYPRNREDISRSIRQLLKQRKRIKGVVMVATYHAAAQFIKKAREARLDALLANVSFVGSQALATKLKSMGPRYADGIIVTQVVPHYMSSLPGVAQYRDHLQRYFPAEKPDFVSFEGYLAARVLVEGLQAAGPDLNTETLIDALLAQEHLDLGIGAPVGFGPDEHQASHTVWGTVLDRDGVYRTLDLY